MPGPNGPLVTPFDAYRRLTTSGTPTPESCASAIASTNAPVAVSTGSPRKLWTSARPLESGAHGLAHPMLCSVGTPGMMLTFATPLPETPSSGVAVTKKPEFDMPGRKTQPSVCTGHSRARVGAPDDPT